MVGRGVANNQCVREDCRVGERGAVEDAESFVGAEVDEVFAFDLDLGVAGVGAAFG